MSKTDDFSTVRRAKAKSGKLDYAPALVLRETGVSKLTALAFFFKHTDWTEFQLKIIGEKKKPKASAWDADESKTITIGEEGSRSLLKMLQTHLAVAEQSDTGEFIAVRLSDGGATSLGAHKPEDVAKALVQLISQPDILQHLEGTELSAKISSALRGAIRVSEMRSAVAQLRAFLDQGEDREQVYQDWCTEHCWAFGNAYVMRDDVRAISIGDKLDLLLPTVIAGYRDIVELKRPSEKVLGEDTSHRNHYFAGAVSKAIGQCHRYLDILHREAENGLLDHREVVAYHPRAIIVIGRSQGWSVDQERALHGLNRRLNGITVMTYDHLLAQGERLIKMVDPDDAATDAATPDDDIPW